MSFTATVSAAGTYANPTGGSCAVDPNNNVPETNEGNNSCSNSVTVIGPPTISKASSPSTIAVGGTSTLSFTLTNPNTGAALSDVAFSDTLPAGVEVAAPPNVNNSCAGTVSATAGTGVISLSGGSIAAGQSCAISVDVTATSGGSARLSDPLLHLLRAGVLHRLLRHERLPAAVASPLAADTVQSPRLGHESLQEPMPQLCALGWAPVEPARSKRKRKLPPPAREGRFPTELRPGLLRQVSHLRPTNAVA